MVKASGEIIFSELLKGDDGVFRTLLTAEGLSEFEIAAVADRILVMNKGNVMMLDTVENVFKNANSLHEIGLNVPNITKVFLELKKQGINIPVGVYTMERAVQVLLDYKRNGGDINA